MKSKNSGIASHQVSKFTGDARQITLFLQGTWYRSYGTAACPVCQPEAYVNQNALTLTNSETGRLLLNCKKSGCSFLNILAAAGVNTGQNRLPDSTVINERIVLGRADAEKKKRFARELWDQAKHIKGTIAENYLRSRGITCKLPDSLRFHPAAWHPTGQRIPAMLAKVDGAESFAIHRTYLRPDGQVKATEVPNKAMLGKTSGGAVRLCEFRDTLAVGEGIETALSLLCGLLSGPVAVWAALSAPGLIHLRLPDRPGRLIVATDGDEVGHSAGQALAVRAAEEGWAVSILPAPIGCDWNDVLNSKAELA